MLLVWLIRIICRQTAKGGKYNEINNGEKEGGERGDREKERGKEGEERERKRKAIKRNNFSHQRISIQGS